MVSKEYTDRENSSGDAERVWTAHLKDLPEVEFELISHRTVSLFVTYDMETTYHLEMGRFYLENYMDSSPSALSGLETGTDVSEEHLTVSGIYDTASEIDTICREMGNLEDYIAAQEYPCQITYALAYREPLTLTPQKSHLPCGTPAYLRMEAHPILTFSMPAHLQIHSRTGRGTHSPDTPLPIGLRQISLLKTSLMLRQANTAVSVFHHPA